MGVPFAAVLAGRGRRGVMPPGNTVKSPSPAAAGASQLPLLPRE